MPIAKKQVLVDPGARPTIGSTRDGCVSSSVAPVELCTVIKAPYQQLDKHFCLCYSMANALFYADYKPEANH